MPVGAWCGVLIMAFFVSVAGQGPPPPRRPLLPGGTATSSATEPVSAVALATWVTRSAVDAGHRLEVLVVWRGQPGWDTRSGPRTSSAGGSGTAFSWSGRYGDVELRLDLESATRTAAIQGTKVDLGDNNVVLVDDVDVLHGAVVTMLLHVDPAVPLLPAGRPDIDAVLLKSAAVVSFLRCDVQLPGGRALAVMGSTCSRVLAVDPPTGR
jgi:hypothetical protein